MTVTCPEGHRSESTDYCDTCGAPIAAAAAASAVGDTSGGLPGSVLDLDPAEQVATVTCPHCGGVNVADALFCEACGYDFTTGAPPLDDEPTPVVEEPAAEQVVEEPEADELVVEEPEADELVVEELEADEQVVQEPEADEPVVEEPKGDEDARAGDVTDVPTAQGGSDDQPEEPDGPGEPEEPERSEAPDEPQGSEAPEEHEEPQGHEEPEGPDESEEPEPLRADGLEPEEVDGASAASGLAPDPEPAPPPEEEAPAPAVPAPPPAREATPAHARPRHTPPSRALADVWVVEVWVDPDWYAVQQTEEACPSAGVPDIVVVRRNVVLVGRPSGSLGVRPDVDAGADSAVSRRHAQLTSDGRRWWIEDLGSSNGTYVGEVGEPLPTTPLTPGVRVEIDRDDRIYVGAWTRLVIRQATASEQAGQG